MQITRGVTRRPGARWLDLLVCLLLFAGSVTYIACWPATLGGADEGLFLYEAKRILQGDVFYRDIYDIITPGAHYVLALLYWTFGTNIVTAKVSMALLHGVTVVILYAICRVLNVQRALAVVPAFAYVALCQPVWPYASPHWVSTTLSLVLMLMMLRRPPAARPVTALIPGLVAGMMIAVQQQRGVVFLGAAATLLVLYHFIDRGFGWRVSATSLASTVAALLAGAALIVIPLFTVLLAVAGFTPLFRALIEHPLVTYRGYNRASWGYVALMTLQFAGTTFPRLLKYVPAILILALGRGLRDWWQERNFDELKVQATLIVFGVFSAVSIAYFPDIIHLALIAPVFFIAVMESLAWLSRLLDGFGAGTRPSRVVVAAVALVLVSGLAVQLYRNLDRSRGYFSESLETPFGHVDFPRGTKEIDIVRKTNGFLQDVPSRTMFIYPVYASLYLMTDAKNATPYQMLIPRYNLPESIPEVIDILEQRQVPLVFVFKPYVSPDDPLLLYVRTHYAPLDAEEMFWKRVSKRE